MQYSLKRSAKGFTLVEIMIVVAIIALLAAIAVPNFLRARKRSQATRILEDLRLLDHAMDQYAIDTAKVPGFTPAFADLQNYLKTDTTLYATGADLFGDTYGPFVVDSTLSVPTSAYNTLSDVADASFWGSYGPSGGGADGDTGGGSGGGGNVAAQMGDLQAQILALQQQAESMFGARDQADMLANNNPNNAQLQAAAQQADAAVANVYAQQAQLQSQLDALRAQQPGSVLP